MDKNKNFFISAPMMPMFKLIFSRGILHICAKSVFGRATVSRIIGGTDIHTHRKNDEFEVFISPNFS